MDAVELRAQMAAVASAHGPWHSHNIHLGDGVWTISDRAPAETGRVRRYLQLVSDAAGSPLSELRVLDLACEEGAFGIEMARGGAEVVAVEGRAANVARARFAAQALGLDRYEVHEEDVRNVDAGSYGKFDVVLNIGILYHLDQPAVFELLENLALMCRRVMMLSTHHSRFAERTVEWGGRRYSGSYVVEHRPDADPDTRLRNLRASLYNTRSFWLTRPSLYNLLADVGFSSVVELRMPKGIGSESSPATLSTCSPSGGSDSTFRDRSAHSRIPRRAGPSASRETCSARRRSPAGSATGCGTTQR